MDDKEIEQKIEELMEKWESDQLLFSECIKEAILFGQSRMKQRVLAVIPEEFIETSFTTVGLQRKLGHNRCRNQVLEAVEKL